MPFLKIPDRGRELYYTWTQPPNVSEADTKDTPTIIFVHGLGSSSSFYATIIPQLSESGFQCLALDSHGSGLTQYTGQDGGIDQIVKDVGAAISLLGLSPSKTIVVGHSMGGIVAPKVTLGYHLAGTILLGPVLPNEVLSEMIRARIKIVEEKGMDGVATSISSNGPGPKAKPLHRAFIRALLLSQKPEGYITNCKAIETAEIPEYSKIKTPLLIIAGSEDKVCPMKYAETILEGWGSSEKRIRVIDGIGHWHCIEGPEVVGAAVLEFANSLKLSS